MLLLDTSVLIDLPQLVVPEDAVALSALTYAELALGAELPDDPAVRRSRRSRLSWLDSLGLEWLPFDQRAGDGYARVGALVAQTRRSHSRSKDVMIAGHAFALGASVATLNPRDFELMEPLVPVVVPARR